MMVGRALYTKDGRKIGNAIIVGIDEHDELGLVAEIRTDFGNTARMTRDELDARFYFGEMQCLQRRFFDQIGLLWGIRQTRK